MMGYFIGMLFLIVFAGVACAVIERGKNI